MDMDFSDLLKQAENLLNFDENDERIPHLQRSFPQVIQQLNELVVPVPPDTDVKELDMKAQALLASRGIDLLSIENQLKRVLENLHFGPLVPEEDIDIEAFLNNERENAIISMIESCHADTQKKVQENNWNCLMNKWQLEKLETLTALNQGDGINPINLKLNDIEKMFAKEVENFNSITILGGKLPNLLKNFQELAKTFEDPKVNDMYEILKYMTDSTSMPFDPKIIKKRYVIQAKKYLEFRYRAYITSVVNKNLLKAQLGGLPIFFNTIKAYVGLTANVNTSSSSTTVSIDGKPLWGVVYFCLRCGDKTNALISIQNSADRFNHELLIEAIKAKISKPEMEIPSELTSKLRMEYFSKFKKSSNPYKKAVYCIIGGFDVNEPHPKVIQTTDDFLWFQLSFVNDIIDNDDTKELTYKNLQTTIIKKYGEDYFNAKDQIHSYFQVLALTGQFEAALEFLARSTRYRIHAVHMAIALYELSLLSLPKDARSSMLTIDDEDPAPMQRLNYARLIMFYVQKFEKNDIKEALNYFYLLREQSNLDGNNLFLYCVADLALETREYKQIFGEITDDNDDAAEKKMSVNEEVSIEFGKVEMNECKNIICKSVEVNESKASEELKVPQEFGETNVTAYFEKFESKEFSLYAVCSLAGDLAAKKENLLDAVNLYALAKNSTQCLHYLNILLSQYIYEMPNENLTLKRLPNEVNRINKHLKSNYIKCDEKVFFNFNQLQMMLKFFTYFYEKQFYAAFDVFINLHLAPLDGVDLQICHLNFKRLTTESRLVFPKLLLTAMICVQQQYKELLQKHDLPFTSGKIYTHQKHLRESAKSIINIAGSVEYRLPDDVTKRLLEIETLIL